MLSIGIVIRNLSQSGAEHVRISSLPCYTQCMYSLQVLPPNGRDCGTCRFWIDGRDKISRVSCIFQIDYIILTTPSIYLGSPSTLSP